MRALYAQARWLYAGFARRRVGFMRMRTPAFVGISGMQAGTVVLN